ncbi:hypothetical protein [Actinoplanes sp. RD1]|uniref:hypothetical protein n=1 Tax=Actinoplanes sp. RD1 TaxID=3064538 RepID=UPI002741326B|nr:hypothetical protein [Actinoplanes sp. RD1]
MATPDLPESLRAQLARQADQSPVETVREFMLGHVADAQSLQEVRGRLRRIAQHSTRLHRRVLRALESVTAAPLPEGTLARLVGWDGNWVLDDQSDAGAAEFLRELAQLLRGILEEPDQAR